MANVIPIAVAIFTVFVVASVPSDASECTLNNIEVLSQFIDERINATVAAIIAEVTATLEESIIAASVNATFDALNATVDDRISAAVNATVDERITTVRTTIDAHGVSIAKLLSQPGKCVVASSPGPLPAFQYCI